MTYLKIENCTSGDGDSEPGEWGSWWSSATNHLESIRIVKENRNYDIIADFDVSSGDIVYVVYAEYDSGNSFGSSSGNISYVGVYKTEEKAHACADEVKRSRKSYDDKNKPKATYITESGKEIVDSWPAWCGYFEQLSNVEVKEMIIE